MYLVTGGAGFIGSNLICELNRWGMGPVVVADDLTDAVKVRNLTDLQIADFIDWRDLQDALQHDKFDLPIKAVLHQGACSDTMMYDGRLMMQMNFEASKRLLHFSLNRQIPMIYASSAAVYGGSNAFAETPENEKPLNVYGYSKLLFDQYVRQLSPQPKSSVVGLRYFNVYGPRETHKKRMASIAYQMLKQLRTTGKARLFGSSLGYEDGEHLRDFIYVGDVVAVNLFFLERAPLCDVFNVGTGEARSFNDVARALIDHLGYGEIEYVEFPKELMDKYQAFTQADITRLRAAGFDAPFHTVEQGMAELIAAYPDDCPIE